MRCKTCRRGLGLVRLSVCTAERDAVCGCPEGQVCVKDPINQAQCKGCEDLMPCPSGTYTETAGNSSSHPVCSPCPIGTFNTEASLTAVCVNHTDCSRLGKIQADPGTPESDAVCKDSDTTVWFVWVCLAALCLCVPVMMISCIRKRLRPHIRDCHQAEKGGHKTSQLPLLSSSSSSSSSIQQCLSPPPALPPAPLEQDQHVGHAISRAPHCSHPIITGGMTVNGNVFIYNGSTINNAPLASAPSPAPAPSPSLPHSVEESPVPTQEQQGPPGSVQERGKDFHISVEESRERDCGL
ncbi:tumor necrosis factor receptor superfamily member 3 isoform X2 [Amia ocellicauda]